MKTHSITLEHLLQRHRAFWTMDEVDTPLLSVGKYVPLQHRKPFPLADGSPAQEGDFLLPELVDTNLLLEQSDEPGTVVNGDFINGRGLYDLCWTEAIAGCPIRWRGGHVWADPFLDDTDDVDRLRVNEDNPWLAVLLEETRLRAEQAKGAYPIVQPLLRGPIDIASAVMGDEPLCWTMVDEPDHFRRLLEACTDVFLAVAAAWRDATSVFQDGTCIYGIWAPGTTVRMQADNAALMSPDLYREFLLPCDARISSVFEYPMIHTHSGVLHIMVDALLDLDSLSAIQVSLDYPAPPPIDELLPVLKQTNAHKPLIITGAVTQHELDILLESLSPAGLCLQVGLRNEE